MTSGSTGAVTVQGTGGDTTGGATAGVFVLNGTVTSGGSGTVGVQGSSGAASGTANAGVYVTGSQATITSGGGGVSVVGQTSNGSQDHGVNVQGGGSVTAGGNGTVTIQSTGGTSGVVVATPTYTYSASEAINATPAAVSIATVLATHYSDADTTSKPGIAVAETSGAGTWQFFNGSAWATISAVSLSNASLLPQADKLRFMAAGLQTLVRSADLVFTAWDGSLGSNNGRFNISTLGGGSAFSKSAGQLAVTVTPIVAAPVWLATSTTLTAVLPGSSNPAGQSVQQAFGSVFSGDSGQLPGIAVAGLTGASASSGTWQYALYNSGTNSLGSFQNMPKVSASSALLLGAQDAIRYVPNSANFTGNVTLLVHAWDGSTGTDGATTNLSKSKSTGGKTAFSKPPSSPPSCTSMMPQRRPRPPAPSP